MFITPCTEIVRVTGANILRDPGFETHSATTPTGPDGEHFAGENGAAGLAGLGFGLEWIDDTRADDLIDVSGWFVFNNPDPSYYWRISTANPRSGTYHARYEFVAEGIGATVQPDSLIPMGGKTCDPTPWSARVVAGDVVTFTAYVYISDNTDDWEGDIFFQFFDTNFDEVGNDPGSFTALSGGSYVQCTYSQVVPAGGVYAWANVLPFSNSVFTTDAMIDIDDCTLEVA